MTYKGDLTPTENAEVEAPATSRNKDDETHWQKINTTKGFQNFVCYFR